MKEIIKQNLIGVISDGQFKPSYYIQMAYGEIASEIGFKDDFVKNVIDLFNDWDLITEEFKSINGEMTTKYKVFIKHNVDGCIIAEVEGNWHFNIEELQKTGLKRMDDLEEIEEDSADVRLYFTKSHKNEVVKFTKTLKDYIIEEVDDDMSPIYLVVQTRNGFDLEEFDIKNPKMDLELNYGKTFTDVNKRIITELSKKKNKGLVLLHGEPGTGKTTYIKWLVGQLNKNKKVIFVPPFLTESITSPEFVPFLARYTDSVLVIEDAERVVSDRVSGSGSSIGVSNILNMTDGIMGDVMNIQIICSFNMHRNKIDPALLRKGRLIAEHKFDALDVESTNNLLKHLGHEQTTTKSMTLADIYNIDEKEFGNNRQWKQKGWFLIT
jgi:SpoVK/Ycf46/Vps4 family AAA+-type ATPase